jgi:uncharacterized protein (TIGR02001 family)
MFAKTQPFHPRRIGLGACLATLVRISRALPHAQAGVFMIKTIQRLLGASMLTSAMMSGAAQAEVAASGNIAFASDYVFRGISQTNTEPAVQGGFDVSADIFYAGAWASNLSGYLASNYELDLYAGVKPVLGPVSMDFGLVGYFYPGANDSGGELDYYEAKAAASVAPAEGLTLGAAVFYSPEFYGETSAALYLEANAAFVLSDALSISGAFGQQSIDDVDGPVPGALDDDYTTWNIGAAYALSGFTFDLRYIGSSIEATDNIVLSGFTTTDNSGETLVLTIKRAL